MCKKKKKKKKDIMSIPQSDTSGMYLKVDKDIHLQVMGLLFIYGT